MHCNKSGSREAADLPEGHGLQSRLMGAASLIHGDPRACCTVQQPLEVEAGELVISVLRHALEGSLSHQGRPLRVWQTPRDNFLSRRHLRIARA